MKNTKVHFCSILLMILGRKKGKKGAFFLLQSFGQNDTTKKLNYHNNEKKKRKSKNFKFPNAAHRQGFLQVFEKKRQRKPRGRIRKSGI
jgi:hypothetical protein